MTRNLFGRFAAPTAAAAFMAVLACGAGRCAASETVALKTRISSVVVYNGQAQVTRAGTVRLAAGTARLVCDDLPAGFVAQSLQVRGEGTAAVTILGTDVVTLREDPSESPRFKELRRRLALLEDRADSLGIAISAFKSRQKFVEDLAAFPLKQGNEKLAPEIFRIQDWKTLMDFLQAERTGAETRAGELQKARGELEQEIAWINHELGRMSSVRRGQRVAIDCVAASAGELRLELTYLVPGSRWSPEYTVRFEPAEERLVLTYNARLQQATGEDWEGALATLSTALPHAGAAPPHLQPHYIGRRPPPVPARMEQAAVDALALKSGVEATSYDGLHVRGGGSSEAEFQAAAVSAGEFAASFLLPAAVDVASGADPKRVRVLQGRLEGKISRYSAPRLKDNVFVRATATNTLEAPILPGQAEVYIEGRAPGGGAGSVFVGRQALSAVAAGGEFNLHLGVDQELKVGHRLEKREYVEREGRKYTKIRYHYLITLENFKRQAAAVTLRDRIPVPTLRDIRIEKVDIDPRPDEHGEDGILTWNLEPAAGGKVEIRLAYTVVFPGDWPEHELNLE